MYEIIYSKDAEKFLDKLPQEQRERIINTIERARVRPDHYFERLVGDKASKLRIGDYRIIADIDNGQLLILIIKIGHRKNIYD